jgi:hypothetical protein
MDVYQKLHKLGQELFDKRMPLLSLWQELADNMYPERSAFTTSHTLGEDFGSHLMTSYPVVARRDLANMVGAMMRPSGTVWAHIRTDRQDDESTEDRAWLERSTNIMYRVMYDKRSLFSRATKEGDHDYVTFGQCVISIELNKMRDGLLYRCWHLRDVAWQEDDEGRICPIFRKWKAKADDLMSKFGKKCHQKIVERHARDPFCECDVWHMVVPTHMLGKDYRTPYVSIYYDVENRHVMEEVGVFDTIYVIPRWVTVSDSQYAISPASHVGIADARTLQQIVLTLMEGGEKAVYPPMVAVQEALRSDLNLMSRGVTYVDASYDERLGEVLRPITTDKSGLPFGLEFMQDVRSQINSLFYLDKLTLPDTREMTAYEASQRVAEYIRQAAPIFEPMEGDYNGQICERTFDLIMRNGGFGPVADMPPTLQGKDVDFVFESPLHEAIERAKGQRFLEASQIIGQATALDPSAAYILNIPAAARDAIHGIQTPAKWLRTETQVQELQERDAAVREAQEVLGAMQQGATIAKDLSGVAVGT